jgi:cyclic pyranopterin phosphate synthase
MSSLELLDVSGRRQSPAATPGHNAALRRITVSLESLDNEVFAAVNDVGFWVERVLAGIEAAAAAGIGPIKINMVVKRGVSEASVVPMARHVVAATSCVSSSTWTSVIATAGGWTRWCRRRRSSR